jgi:hypothetical protein
LDGFTIFFIRLVVIFSVRLAKVLSPMLLFSVSLGVLLLSSIISVGANALGAVSLGRTSVFSFCIFFSPLEQVFLI